MLTEELQKFIALSSDSTDIHELIRTTLQMSDETQPEESSRAAAARARRLKILENSNKRLTKLTGREFNEDIPILESTAAASQSKKATNGDIYPDPDFERDVFEAVPLSLNPAVLNPDFNDPFAFLQSMQMQGQGGGQNAFFGAALNGQNTQRPPVPESQFQKIIKSKYLIVFMAVLTYLLFALHIDYIIGGSVFSILVAWELFEFGYSTFIAPDTEQNAIVTAVFALIGITPEKGRVMLKILGLTNKIVKDIAIFLFTFVLMHVLWCRLILNETFSQILDKDFENILKSELEQ